MYSCSSGGLSTRVTSLESGFQRTPKEKHTRISGNIRQKGMKVPRDLPNCKTSGFTVPVVHTGMPEVSQYRLQSGFCEAPGPSEPTSLWTVTPGLSPSPWVQICTQFHIKKTRIFIESRVLKAKLLSERHLWLSDVSRLELFCFGMWMSFVLYECHYAIASSQLNAALMFAVPTVGVPPHCQDKPAVNTRQTTRDLSMIRDGPVRALWRLLWLW